MLLLSMIPNKVVDKLRSVFAGDWDSKLILDFLEGSIDGLSLLELS